MNLLHFAGVCFITLLVTHFWWVPRLSRAIRKSPTSASLPRVARLALVRYGRGIALVGLVTSLGIAGLVEILSWRGSPAAMSGVVRAALAREREFKQALDAAHPYWFAGIAVLLTSALAIYTYRRRYVQCELALAAARDAEVDRLIRKMNEDPTWWDLPPNREMERILERYNSIREMVPGLSASDQEVAYQSMLKLREMFTQADIVRRMDVRFDPDAIEDPAPETWREWAAGLFGSPRVAGFARGGTRLLYRFNGVLLVLGMIGFESHSLDRLVQDRLVSLSDLSVQIDRVDELTREVAQAEAFRKEPEDKASTDSRPTTRANYSPRQAAEKVQQVQADLERVKATRPKFDAEHATQTVVSDEVDVVAAKLRRFEEFEAELRRAAVVDRDGPPRPTDPDGPKGGSDPDRPKGGSDPDGPKKGSGSGPKKGPGGQLAEVRAKFDREAAFAKAGDPLKPKATALEQRLATIDPEADLRPIRDDAATLERRVGELRTEAEARPRKLADRLRNVGKLPGREAEIARLEGRINRLVADTAPEYIEAGDRLKGLRAQVDAEVASRVSEVRTLREQANGLIERAQQVDSRAGAVAARVEGARTKLAAADAKLDWERARPSTSAAPRALSPAEFEAVDRVSRAYEVGLGESSELKGTIPESEPATARELRALATREEILARAQKVAPSGRVRTPSIADSPGLSDGQKAVIKSAESVFQDDAPRTKVGQAMRDWLAREAEVSPNLRETIVREAGNVRPRPIAGGGSPPRAPPGRRFWGELRLTAFDAAINQVAGPDVAGAVSEISRTTLVDYEQIHRYQFVRSLAGQGGLDVAMDRLRAGDPRSPLPGSGRDYIQRSRAATGEYAQASRAVAPYEPAIEVPFESGVKLDRAGSIVMEHAAKGKPSEAAWRARNFSDGLQDYASTFPSQPGMERVTPRAQVLAAAESTAAGPESGLLKPKKFTFDPQKLGEWTAGRGGSDLAGQLKTTRIELPRSAMPLAPNSNAGRARDFLRLHSSPKVGGVLIGRKPELQPPPRPIPLDLTALRWQVEGDEVKLTVVDRAGVAHRSRGFRRDLAELGLAYAADGRPTAVTIIYAQPLGEKRVLLHPSLVDTRAGRAIVRTDNIIFHLIANEPWYREVIDSVRAQVELYRRGWALRQEVLGDLGVLRAEYVKTVRDEREAVDSKALTAAFGSVEAIGDPMRSPLSVKRAYYDNNLVKAMILAGGPGRSLDEFDRSIISTAHSELGLLEEWYKGRGAEDRALSVKVAAFNARAKAGAADSAELLSLQMEQNRLRAEAEKLDAKNKANDEQLDRIIRRWMAPVPKLAHVSGIREKAYVPTLADCFVPEGKDVPPVLDYLIQITYDTPPYFLQGDPPDVKDEKAWEGITAYADPSPWEFPMIAARVREVVKQALEADPSMAVDRDAVATLAEFTMLQRLFRLGLAGDLGDDFPIEALAELHRGVAPSSPPPPVRTPRWQSEPGGLESQLRTLVDFQTTLLAGDKAPAGAPEGLRSGLKVLAALSDEYPAHVDDRDKALDAVEAIPGGIGSKAWDDAWDAFQKWDVEWEARLASTVADLERATPAPPLAGGPGADSPEARFVDQIRWYSNAIALRRSLDVAADDRYARIEDPQPK